MHIQFVLFDGFDPLDVIAPYEVLHAGGSASGGAVTVELVSAEGPREVTSGIGALALRAVGAVDLERADMLLVPGAFGRVGEPGRSRRRRWVPVAGSRTSSSRCFWDAR